MTLSDIKAGQSAKVTQIECKGAIRKRLVDMGITPGVTITLVRTAPFGDPLQISLRGYALTLRKSEASKIYIDQMS